MSNRILPENIDKAVGSIDPVFLNTPQYRCTTLEDALGCRLTLKVETANPVRSFKGRGACHTLSRFAEGTKLICASAGNFGQALAYVCADRQIDLVVYACTTANPFKIDLMRRFGAEVRLFGDDFDTAKQEAKRVATTEDRVLLEDSFDVATCEGAGTIGPELLRSGAGFDAVLIALGNGALLTGIGTWLKSRSPGTEVIGVVADGAPAMEQSWRSGRIVEHPTIDTIADGIGVRLPIAEVLGDMNESVDDVVRVTDEAMVTGMRLLHRHAGLVVEPSGAAGVAAILADSARFRDRSIAAVICGGNMTPEQVRQYLG